MSTFQVADDTYRIEKQPPPGTIVAPDGFPANPRPDNAPKVFADAMSIRIEVFCDEQKCRLSEELDPDDPKSWSFVMYRVGVDGVETPVSTIRIVPPPHPVHPNGFEDPNEAPYIKLTRVATVASARGKGLSKVLIQKSLQDLGSQPDLIGNEWKGLVLTHAQVDVEGMYSRMGFVTDPKLGRWDEEGIDHVGMWKELSTTTGYNRR